MAAIHRSVDILITIITVKNTYGLVRSSWSTKELQNKKLIDNKQNI